MWENPTFKIEDVPFIDSSPAWRTASKRRNSRIARMRWLEANCCKMFLHFLAEHKPGLEPDETRTYPNACMESNCTKIMCIDRRRKLFFRRLAPYFLPLLALKNQETLNHVVFTTGRHKATVTSAELRTWSNSLRQAMRRFPELRYVVIVENKRQPDGLYHVHFHMGVLSWNCPNVNELRAAWNEVCAKKHKTVHDGSFGHFAVHAERAYVLKTWAYFAKRLAEWGLARDHATDEIYYAASHEELVRTSYGLRKLWSHGLSKAQIAAEHEAMLKVYHKLLSEAENADSQIEAIKSAVDDLGNRDFLNYSEQLNILQLLKWLVAPSEWHLTFLGSSQNGKPDGLPPDAEQIVIIQADIDRLLDKHYGRLELEDRSHEAGRMYAAPQPSDPPNRHAAVLSAVRSGCHTVTDIQNYADCRPVAGVKNYKTIPAKLSLLDIMEVLLYHRTHGLIYEISPGRYGIV